MELYKENHKPEMKGNLWEGKEIVHAIEFEPCGTFGAVSAAEVCLRDMDYESERLQGDKPVFFYWGHMTLWEWRKMSFPDKLNLDGVIIPVSDFREGGAMILFFKPPQY